MKKFLFEMLVDAMDTFLDDADANDGDHELVHSKLAKQMAEAAALVYDSGQLAQKFERSQRSALRRTVE